MMKRALKQMFSSSLYIPYFLATSRSKLYLHGVQYTSFCPWSSLELDLTSDVLGGDGQQAAVHGRELFKERLQSVELGRGDVTKVHRIEHQHHELPLHGVETEGLHHPLIIHNVQVEARSKVTRDQRHFVTF